MTAPVFYAKAADDLVLPIVDVTHPAFTISISADELATLSDQYVRESSQSQEIPPETRAALASSRLGRGLMAARGTFLTGLNTYLLKLGPENIPADFHPIDKRIAASFPSTTARVRLQDMTKLVCDGVGDPLAASAMRPLRLVNIAGGPAADSWNILITLRGRGLLDRRDVTVKVLDVDDQGPAFGERAFHVLQSDGGPLHGLPIEFTHNSYNWTAPAALSGLLASADLSHALTAITSEGGLFEYGSDEDVTGNLAALHELTASDTIVVGSACRDSEATRAHTGIGVTLRPRPRAGFQALVEQSGWRVDALIERPFNDNVRLVKR